MQALDKAQRQHLENVREEATEERQRELGRSADQALHALAPIYSLLVLQYSTYKQVSQPLSTPQPACFDPSDQPLCLGWCHPWRVCPAVLQLQPV